MDVIIRDIIVADSLSDKSLHRLAVEFEVEGMGAAVNVIIDRRDLWSITVHFTGAVLLSPQEKGFIIQKALEYYLTNVL